MPPRSDWDPEPRRPRAKASPSPDEASPYCSSDDFARMLRDVHPELVVPEHDIVYLGTGAPGHEWDETPPTPGAPCPKCGGLIDRGSLLCCPKCHRSGFEARLKGQRDIAGLPPPEPKNEPPPAYVDPKPKTTAATPRPLTRKERRRERYGHPCPTSQPPPDTTVSSPATCPAGR